MATKISITIKTDPDGFYGAEGSQGDGSDYDRYTDMVNTEIWKQYPGAEIEHEFEPTMNPGAHVAGGDDENESEIDYILEKIYNDGKFWNA